MNHHLSALSLALLVAPAGLAQDAVPGVPPEVAAAMARAGVHNKRVLAVFPAEGQDLAAMLKKDRTLSRKLLYEFETVQLTGEDAKAQETCWGVVERRPALVVLGAEGTVLARLFEGDVLADGAVAGAPLLEKLGPHFCPPVDAQKKLDDALAVAKKTGRNVFIRFDAPW